MKPDGRHTPTNEFSGTGGNAPGRSEESSRVIWGTNISADAMQNKIKNFLMHFQVSEEEEEDEDEDIDYARLPYYVDKIRSLTSAGISMLEIDCQHILQHDPELYRQLEMYPTEILQLIDMVCSLVAKENVRQDALTGANTNLQSIQNEEDLQNVGLIQACPYNLNVTQRIRDLTPQHIDKYI